MIYDRYEDVECSILSMNTVVLKARIVLLIAFVKSSMTTLIGPGTAEDLANHGGRKTCRVMADSKP